MTDFVALEFIPEISGDCCSGIHSRDIRGLLLWNLFQRNQGIVAGIHSREINDWNSYHRNYKIVDLEFIRKN